MPVGLVIPHRAVRLPAPAHLGSSTRPTRGHGSDQVEEERWEPAPLGGKSELVTCAERCPAGTSLFLCLSLPGPR